jgi:hypothetical protein
MTASRIAAAMPGEAIGRFDGGARDGALRYEMILWINGSSDSFVPRASFYVR